MPRDCKEGLQLIQGQECIQCVRCDVVNCKHNDKQNHCTARNIRVGPRFANCCSDTICDTFEME